MQLRYMYNNITVSLKAYLCFYVLLTVLLSIIIVIIQLNAQNLVL